MTMRTMVLMVAVVVLAGCGSAPTGAEPAGAERVLRAPVAKSTSRATPKARATVPAGFVAGPGSALAHAASTAPSAAPTSVASAEAPAAYVSVVSTPDETLRVFPMRTGDGRLLDAEFAPADGALEWVLRAPETALMVSKIKITIDGASAPVTIEAPPDAFGLPAALEGETRLAVPFSVVATYKALAAEPATMAFRATVTFYDADGGPIPQADGSALALTTTLDVQ